MRILLLTHYFEPEEGAPQRRWRALVEGFVAAGHEVDVVSPPPHYPSGRLRPEHRKKHGANSRTVTEYGAVVHRVSYLWHDGGICSRSLDHLWVAFASIRRARVLLRRGQLHPDVIIATAPGLPTLIAGQVAARILRTPFVAEMRDAWPDLVSYTPGLAHERGPIGRVKQAVHSRVTDMQRRAAHVVTTTERFADVLRERGVERTSVIRNGTTLARYAVVPARDQGHDELRVLYIGTIGRSQGLDVLIHAAASLRSSAVPVHVRIVGAGADVPRLKALNAHLGSPVEILSAVPGFEVARYYAWADTCVVSLRNWEPFAWTVPSKLYELMASGRHISGIVAGEAAEIIRSTDSGDVVPPGDVIALAGLWRAIREDRSRLETGNGGRNWVAANVDFATLVEGYEAVLRGVVARASAA